MVARLLRAEDRPFLEGFLARSPSSTLYHDFRWNGVVERTFGHPTYYLLSEEDGSITGVLPLVHIKSILFGNMLVSMPYFNYGGICANGDSPARLLLEKAVGIAEEVGAGHLELRQETLLDKGFRVKTSKVSMRLELTVNPEDLWRKFPSKLRSQVRLPEKQGLRTEIARLGELDNFYQIFSANMRNLGTPVYPKEFFRNILETFPDSTWICTVKRNEVPVASGFLAGFKERLEIPWASSLREHKRSSPNMLLYWNCLKFACERGYRIFDFGRSTPGEGTYRFKEQWGASPIRLHWHYWTKDGSPIPEITPKNPKYRLAIGLWKRLPLPVTRYLGPMIVKNIP